MGIGLTATVFVFIFDVLVHSPGGYMVISLVSTFLAVFFSSRYFIKRFFIFKIKPLYQIVVKRDFSTKELAEELLLKSDMVTEIRQELEEWKGRENLEIGKYIANERFRKDFLSNVSHEIKTPIFMIQGYVQTLLDGAVDDPEIAPLYLERTGKNVERLVNIIHDLDEITKFESGEVVPYMTDFDLKELVRETIPDLAIEAAKQGISIVVAPSGGHAPMAFADRERIGQVFFNLIDNSIKYGKPGGTTTIHFLNMDDKWLVEVEDNGIGIDKENLSRVFERFFRADKSRSRERGGTGLGLAIVRHIMEAHQEPITVRSQLTVGTTFSFFVRKSKSSPALRKS